MAQLICLKFMLLRWLSAPLVDSSALGRVRHHHFGEGAYEQSEMVIHRLLAEASGGIGDDVATVNGGGLEAAADWAASSRGGAFAASYGFLGGYQMGRLFGRADCRRSHESNPLTRRRWHG